MSSCAVGRTRHRATERVDLAHQVTLADTADGRVAAHGAQRLDVLRQQQGAAAHAGGRQRGLGAGMAAAHNDDIECIGKSHGAGVCERRG